MRCNPNIALLAWLAVGAVGLELRVPCFIPQCQNQTDIDHFVILTKLGNCLSGHDNESTDKTERCPGRKTVSSTSVYTERSSPGGFSTQGLESS